MCSYVAFTSEHLAYLIELPFHVGRMLFGTALCRLCRLLCSHVLVRYLGNSLYVWTNLYSSDVSARL